MPMMTAARGMGGHGCWRHRAQVLRRQLKVGANERDYEPRRLRRARPSKQRMLPCRPAGSPVIETAVLVE